MGWEGHLYTGSNYQFYLICNRSELLERIENYSKIISRNIEINQTANLQFASWKNN